MNAEKRTTRDERKNKQKLNVPCCLHAVHSFFFFLCVASLCLFVTHCLITKLMNIKYNVVFCGANSMELCVLGHSVVSFNFKCKYIYLKTWRWSICARVCVCMYKLMEFFCCCWLFLYFSTFSYIHYTSYDNLWVVTNSHESIQPEYFSCHSMLKMLRWLVFDFIIWKSSYL